MLCSREAAGHTRAYKGRREAYVFMHALKELKKE